jgi:hypothetical protein
VPYTRKHKNGPLKPNTTHPGYAYKYGAVPVIYGSEVHKLYAPAPDSYLDVRDFASAAELGSRLQYLDSNHTAYLAMHAWRQRPWSELNPLFRQLVQRTTGSVGGAPDPALYPSQWCLLGEKLRELDHRKAPRPALLPLPTCDDPSGADIPVCQDTHGGGTQACPATAWWVWEPFQWQGV